MSRAFDGSFATAEPALLAAASAVTGLHDFGDETEYLPGLRKLLEALHSEVAFTPIGAQMAFGAMLGPLTGRLHAVEGWKQRPDCLATLIEAPLLIIGMPRTGTTALHHLLWLDPQFQAPEMWLIDAPMPRPPRATWQDHKAHQFCEASIAGFLQAVPGFAVAHPRHPDMPDECLDILKQCYANTLWGTTFPVPAYDRWWPRQDHARQYGYLYRTLQLIGADDRRRWLLKDPTSIQLLPAMTQTFADARLIVMHRDPAEVIPSLCSLLRALHDSMLRGGSDIRYIAEREIFFWSKGANALAGLDGTQPRLDVHLRDFQADPMRVVHDLYDHFGLTLAAETEQIMQADIAAAKAAPRTPHCYTLEEFGLDADEIRTHFVPYLERFGARH